MIGTENIVNPLQESALNKKGLCDYVINVASGCMHGCAFCYVPSTPVIRARQSHLRQLGVSDPQMDWGKYLFLRDGIPEKLKDKLSRKRTWKTTPSGKGVVLLCSGTDPYQNAQVAKVTRGAVKVLLEHNKRIRILTRSPLWLKDLDLLSHPNVTVGMSIPWLDDQSCKQIERNAPPPSERYRALSRGRKNGCRVYVAMAPTPPYMSSKSFSTSLESLSKIEPEVIFWEPINSRGSNGKRMRAAGLDFVESITDKQSWADKFLEQWELIEYAADEVGCIDKLHIWPDSELKGLVSQDILDYWWYQPTSEIWPETTRTTENHTKIKRPYLKDYIQFDLLS